MTGMGRERVHVALMLGAALALTGCGVADSRAPVPSFMRAKEAEPPPLEAPPDVKRLVGAKLDQVFTAASHPTHVQVSQPLHDPRGLGWTACVRAELTSVTGTPLGSQTYRISIIEGVISDRRHVETDDTCTSENYEPI
jgi:hypothetical protein